MPFLSYTAEKDTEMKPPEQQWDQESSDDVGFGSQESCVGDARVESPPTPNSLSGPIRIDFIILPIFALSSYSVS